MTYANTNGYRGLPRVRDLLRWQIGLHAERRPRTPRTGVYVPTVANDGHLLRPAVRDGLTWIGHASFLIQLAGRSFLVDPVFSPSLGGVVRRNVEPGLSWSALPPLDAVLITHNHRDHMDEPTLKRLGPDCTYLVPDGLGSWFRARGYSQVVEMSWWDTEAIGRVEVTFVPANHWSRRGLRDVNRSWWGGFVLREGGRCWYHAGDSGWFEGFSDIRHRCGAPDVAMLPIGAYAPRWFMQPQHIDPAGAVRACQALDAHRLVAMHWGTFKLSDEPLDEPPALLRAAWAATGLSDDRCLVPAIGETLWL